MRIKKAGIFIIAAALTCTAPAVPSMAADTSESVQEIISDNEIDSLSSATITSKAVTNGVNGALDFYDLLKGDGQHE